MLNSLSIVIPTLNEGSRVVRLLTSLKEISKAEIIIADGGSVDGTVELAKDSGAFVVHSLPGKGTQMNSGARQARGDILLFLHADTLPPPDLEEHVDRIMGVEGASAGAFRLGIEGDSAGLRIIEAVANRRSRWLQAPYGDQAIFLKRELFWKVGGYPELPIMEDYALIRRLRQEGKILIAPAAVKTSGRRWRNLGIFRTTLTNWTTLAGYHLGVPPDRLSQWYGRRRGVAGDCGECSPGPKGDTHRPLPGNRPERLTRSALGEKAKRAGRTSSSSL